MMTSTSLKHVYQTFYPQLVDKLPTNDDIFMSKLYANKFLPGDTKEKIQQKPTKREKNTLFLDECIGTGFYDDKDGKSSNPIFEHLLTVMENHDDRNLKALASRIRDSE